MFVVVEMRLVLVVSIVRLSVVVGKKQISMRMLVFNVCRVEMVDAVVVDKIIAVVADVVDVVATIADIVVIINKWRLARGQVFVGEGIELFLSGTYRASR